MPRWLATARQSASSLPSSWPNAAGVSCTASAPSLTTPPFTPSPPHPPLPGPPPRRIVEGERERLDNGCGRFRRREHTPPCADIEAGDARLGHRGHAGEQRRALRAG